MLDPEVLVLRGGIIALACLTVTRFVWYEFSNLRNDFRRKRRRGASKRVG